MALQRRRRRRRRRRLARRRLAHRRRRRRRLVNSCSVGMRGGQCQLLNGGHGLRDPSCSTGEQVCVCVCVMCGSSLTAQSTSVLLGDAGKTIALQVSYRLNNAI